MTDLPINFSQYNWRFIYREMTGYSNYLLKDFELLQEYLQLELEESKTTDYQYLITVPVYQ
jgi:hypothetical protein